MNTRHNLPAWGIVAANCVAVVAILLPWGGYGATANKNWLFLALPIYYTLLLVAPGYWLFTSWNAWSIAIVNAARHGYWLASNELHGYRVDVGAWLYLVACIAWMVAVLLWKPATK
jgi:hypothetical protein